ncbi:MAG: hypothetical protein IJA20_08380 [Methanocorpusculum sp.]|nr:hypothetical protein [Oscillospiraceae bacterium]MBQ3570669.1 hypothetical protein [Methanocorpusculum sp.]
MKCPTCGNEMEAGGLLIDGTLVRWVPMETFDRGPLGRLVLTENRVIEHETNMLTKQTKVSNAHFCCTCEKVVGIFDVQ